MRGPKLVGKSDTTTAGDLTHWPELHSLTPAVAARLRDLAAAASGSRTPTWTRWLSRARSSIPSTTRFTPMSSGSEAWHVVRTLRALELLALGSLSAPELADGLGVHVRTARRILRRLEGEGYVALGGGRRRRYRSTMRIVAVAGQVVERADLTRSVWRT